jgi:hypothetical protein
MFKVSGLCYGILVTWGHPACEVWKARLHGQTTGFVTEPLVFNI